MYEFLKRAYYDKEHGEERVVAGGQLYRVTRTKVGRPETNRFTATGSGTVSLTPINEAGEPVDVRDWENPEFVEGRISLLRENFECVRMLGEIGREAYPGEALGEFRELLGGLHEDLQVIEGLWRTGKLDRLDAILARRLLESEVREGLAEGQLRRGRRTLSERYEDLVRRILDLAPVMEQWDIEVPDVVASVR